MFVSINNNTTSVSGGEGTATLQEHKNSSPVGFFVGRGGGGFFLVVYLLLNI